jgi:hypothetical protein
MPRHHKQNQQSSRIQNQFTKINFLSYTNNEKTEKEYRRIIPVYNSIKKIKIPKNKLNKGCERSLARKIINH